MMSWNSLGRERKRRKVVADISGGGIWCMGLRKRRTLRTEDGQGVGFFILEDLVMLWCVIRFEEDV